MIEALAFALVAYLFTSLGVFAWFIRTRDKQTREIMRALLSRDAREFSESKRVEEGSKTPSEEPEQFTALDDLSDDEFYEVLKNNQHETN